MLPTYITHHTQLTSSHCELSPPLPSLDDLIREKISSGENFWKVYCIASSIFISKALGYKCWLSTARIMNELTQNLETSQLIFWTRHDMDERHAGKVFRDCFSQLPAGRCTAACSSAGCRFYMTQDPRYMTRTFRAEYFAIFMNLMSTENPRCLS